MKRVKPLFLLLFLFQMVSIPYALSQSRKKTLVFAPFWPSVRADVTRISGKYATIHLLKALLTGGSFRAIFTMRLCQGVSSLPTPLCLLLTFPCRILHYLAQQMAGITLGWDSNIGPGLLINHGWGLVTGRAVQEGEGIIIGSNVTLFNGVTIGQKHRITAEGRIKLCPKIEDEVWIGPHAVITGDVVIGRGSRIAPGTVVTGDVEPYSIVGGNPMRVLKTNALPDVIHPAEVSS